jgi:hypothetical protein
VIGEWPVAGEYGWPVTVVNEPLCKVCGGDRQDRHQQHAFTPQPWPKLSGVNWSMDTKVMGADSGERPRLVSTGTARGETVKVWIWCPPDVDAATVAKEGVPSMQRGTLEFAVETVLARKLCPHPELNASTAVARILDRDPTQEDPLPRPVSFRLDVRSWCADCGEQLVFKGRMKVGVNSREPTVDVAGTTLSAPMRPMLAPDSFGNDLPGFGVRV